MNQQFSPIFKNSFLKIPAGNVMVIRDDLLPGGTKQRASAPFLKDLMQEGHEHFIYASPFAGFAQVALAYTAKNLGAQCTIICERDQGQAGLEMHPFSVLAQSYGAKMLVVDGLHEAEDMALEMAQKENLYKIPLGFDTPIFRHHLQKELHLQWSYLEKIFPKKIQALWLPLGSGTLARAFHEVVPKHIPINCVNVHVLNPQDERIKSLGEIARIKVFEAPMKFHEKARSLPKIPSNIFYDAKLWDFIKRYAADQDLWWNVAR